MTESSRRSTSSAERRKAHRVTDDELIGIAVLARRAEKHYGCPQDVEWAIDRHLPDGENVVMLQSRPETVWSQKKVSPIAKQPATRWRRSSRRWSSPLHTRKH